MSERPSGGRIRLVLLVLASFGCVGQERPLPGPTGAAGAAGTSAPGTAVDGSAGSGSAGTAAGGSAGGFGGAAVGGFGALPVSFAGFGGFAGAGAAAAAGTSGAGAGLAGTGGLRGGIAGGGLAGGFATCPPNTETPIAGPLVADFSTASANGLPILTPPYRALLLGRTTAHVQNGAWHITGDKATGENPSFGQIGAGIEFGCIDPSSYTGVSFSIDTSGSSCPSTSVQVFDWYGGSVYLEKLVVGQTKTTVKVPLWDWGGVKSMARLHWLPFPFNDDGACTFEWTIDDVTFYRDPGSGGRGGVAGTSNTGAGGGGGTAGGSGAGGSGGGTAGGAGAGGSGGGATAGTAGTGPAAFVSGSRLRAHVLDAGGGAKVFQYWEDQTLDSGCKFRRMMDGSYRCVPWEARQVDFLDPGCTEAVIAVGNGATPPRWGIDVAQVACFVDVVQSVYAPTVPPTTRPTVIYTRVSSQGCAPSPASFDASYLRMAPTNPPFVGAAAGHDAGAGNVSALTLTADDGAQETIAGWDLVRDAECAPAGALFGQLFIGDAGTLIDDRCVPRGAAIVFGAAFSDAACSNPLATAVCPAGATPRVVLDSQVSSQIEPKCRLAIWGVGTALDGSGTYWSNGRECSANMPDPNYYFATLGAPAAANEYPRLQRLESGSGRIRVRSAAAASGPPLAMQQRFYDSALGVDCVSTYTGSPTATICFPDDAGALSYKVGLFADAACTATLFAWDQPCGHPAPSFVLRDFQVPARAVPYTGTTVYANGYNNVVGCVAVPPPPGTTLFAAGAAVPPGTFVEIIETTE